MLPAAAPPKPSLIVPQFLQRTPLCTQLAPAPPLPPTLHFIRALSKANKIPFSPPMALISKNKPYKKNLSIYHQSVSFGPSYISDKLGLPIQKRFFAQSFTI
jgi:hypothetical protein